MTEAATILKMIETVSPDDQKALDEIDAAVSKYLTGKLHKVYEPNPETTFILTMNDKNEVTGIGDKYTRSRDALKAIRPEGWVFRMHIDKDEGCVCDMWKEWQYSETRIHTGSHGASKCTEELAELQAIIQAINYERTKHD